MLKPLTRPPRQQVRTVRGPGSRAASHVLRLACYLDLDPARGEVRLGSTETWATTAQLRNRRLQQDEISALLARVEPNYRATLCSECKTFRLAIKIAEPPRIP